MRYLCLALCLMHATQSTALSDDDYEHAVQDAIHKIFHRHGKTIKNKLQTAFTLAGAAWPPHEIALLAFKQEQYIELWARDASRWKYIHNYPLTASSGGPGPKLREHDKQIPEGIYRPIAFNPFSSMHLSIMLDYPNAFDRSKARYDRRKNPGNNIFLHGKDSSVGCLAIGNEAITELFLLVYQIGLENTRIIIAPNDLRIGTPVTAMHKQPPWIHELYHNLSHALQEFEHNFG